MFVRDEKPADIQDIRRVIQSAFDSSGEADLVDTLRQRALPLVSLVAEADAGVAGHILFSPIQIEGCDELLLGLAPMAVAPNNQRQGIGSALVRHGLSRCRELGAVGVVVLGHAEYYPRFGFSKASGFGITSEYDVPDEVFMAMELADPGLSRISGIARYHPLFGDL